MATSTSPSMAQSVAARNMSSARACTAIFCVAASIFTPAPLPLPAAACPGACNWPCASHVFFALSIRSASRLARSA